MLDKKYQQNNIVNRTSLEKQHEKPFLFDLEPFFASDQLDLTNQHYFPGVLPNSIAAAPYANYHSFSNAYMENEIKGFIRYVVIDRHCSASHTKNYIAKFVQAWTKFVNEKHPHLDSCTDMDYETLYREYLIWLAENDIQNQNVYRIAHVNKEMDWVEFPVKTLYDFGFSVYYKYIDSIRFPDTRKEKEKDIWDVRKLGVPFETLPSRPRYTINYEKIQQPWLKQSMKDYNYFRVQHREMSTVLDDIKAFNLFSAFLADKCPDVQSWSDINRNVVEDYIAYVGSKGFVASTFNRRLSAIKTFFAVGNMMDLEGFPTKPLFMDTDFHKVVHKMPVPFSDNELRQMNAHIDALPLIYGRIFFVLENLGMRMSDICSTPIEVNGKLCLQEHGEGKYLLTYAQPKVHRSNTVPVEPIVAEVIKSAIETSQEKFGDKCKYVFAKNVDEPVGEEDFVMNMNKMSKRNNILTDTGKILRIKGHTFRRTKATEYANMGVSLDVIRLMLGQRSLGVLKHYITIHGDTMIKVLQNITDYDDQLIRNIGHEDDAVIQENAEKGMIPMPNGYCSKNVASGLCEHANACYSCRMFRPSKRFLPLYEQHLKEAQNNIQIAKVNHYDRFLEINTDLKNHLEAIIKAVKE